MSTALVPGTVLNTEVRLRILCRLGAHSQSGETTDMHILAVKLRDR